MLGSSFVARWATMSKYKVHNEDDCKGEFCPFHNPSDHIMKEWKLNVRMDAFAYPLVERICKHGVGHPDPDSVAFLEKTEGSMSWGVHGCDGCCNEKEKV